MSAGWLMLAIVAEGRAARAAHAAMAAGSGCAAARKSSQLGLPWGYEPADFTLPAYGHQRQVGRRSRRGESGVCGCRPAARGRTQDRGPDDAESARCRVRRVASGRAAGTDNAVAAAQGDIVLVTVGDDSIARVVAQVAAVGGFRTGQLVVHMSGALSLSVLGPAAEAGALIGCLHPLQSCATAEDASRMIRGSTFGITPGSGALEALEALVEVLGGHPILVGDRDKAVYHAAAVMASNYLVAVEDAAVSLLVTAGFDEESALSALEPLICGNRRQRRQARDHECADRPDRPRRR